MLKRHYQNLKLVISVQLPWSKVLVMLVSDYVQASHQLIVLLCLAVLPPWRCLGPQSADGVNTVIM